MEEQSSSKDPKKPQNQRPSVFNDSHAISHSYNLRGERGARKKSKNRRE